MALHVAQVQETQPEPQGLAGVRQADQQIGDLLVLVLLLRAVAITSPAAPRPRPATASRPAADPLSKCHILLGSVGQAGGAGRAGRFFGKIASQGFAGDETRIGPLQMRVTLTGGAGFIGSHVATLLLIAGHEVQILDTFRNAHRDVPARIGQIAGRPPEVAGCDVGDEPALLAALGAFRPDAVIHFAGEKDIGEANAQPLEYYRCNFSASITLFRTMQRLSCARLVFSSSAAVYGDPQHLPMTEAHPVRPSNAYGRSKHMVEQAIQDWARAWPDLQAVALRYFNPVGAHPSALIGEAPLRPSSNLFPQIADAAQGLRASLKVFGTDFDTPDGTGVRDFIHVMDLASAHVAALDLAGQRGRMETINVGTGTGYSVLEAVRTFERVSGRKVPLEFVDRRPGDAAASYADCARAAAVLGWRASHGLEDMCRDAWRWRTTRV
jgi:UDP-glucose 4-epimerase